MRASVLPDARLAKHAGRFVWLAIDTENPRNAPFLERYPVEVWPTFLVIDPRDEVAVLRWPGSATVEQIDRLLEDGERRERGGAEALLAKADRAYAAGKADEALAGYREALAAGGADWSRRGRAVESLVLALSTSARAEECADVARREAPGLPRGPSFANAVATGLSCATGSMKGGPWKAAAIAALEPLAREAVALPGILADDRSGLHELLVDAAEARGDAPGAKAAADRWWRFLQAEAVRKESAEARAALDSARVTAAMKLGDPARALPALRASEAALPRDYNPPARQAYVLQKLGRLREARAAAGRALERAYGPRKLRVYALAAGIARQAQDRDGARRLLDEALEYGRKLPEAQRSDRALAGIAEQRRALDEPAL